MSMNRLGNTKNPYQTKARKVLCLCSAGLLRSPTAANVIHQEFGYNTRAAGVSEGFALIFADEVLVEWADEVVCVNTEVASEFFTRHPGESTFLKTVILDVPDEYEWNDPSLRGIILEQYKQKFSK